MDAADKLLLTEAVQGVRNELSAITGVYGIVESCKIDQALVRAQRAIARGCPCCVSLPQDSTDDEPAEAGAGV